MILNFDNIDLTAESLLSKVSEKDIYEYYLGETLKEGQLYSCPFHEDNSPSIGFKLMPSNTLIHKCFGCGEKGNAINFVKKLLNLEYRETLIRIKRDLIGNTDPVRSELRKESTGFSSSSNTLIIPVFQNFSITDYNYWSKYNIPLSLLNKYDIKACKSVYIRTKHKELVLFAEYTKSNPIYCYKIDDKYKIYKPLNPTKVGKWLTTTTALDIQGMKQLPIVGDLLIITSSMKDVLVLNILGYNAIAMGSESSGIPAKILDYLFASFKELVIFYDNDKAGIEYAKKLSSEINSDYIYIPEEFTEKDISDFISKYGEKQTRSLIKTLLDAGRKREEVHYAKEVGNTL